MPWHPAVIVGFASIGFTGALLLTWELFNPKDLIRYDPDAEITLHSLLNSLLLSILCGILAPVIWVMIKAGKTDI
jgi:hypothetical protein